MSALRTLWRWTKAAAGLAFTAGLLLAALIGRREGGEPERERRPEGEEPERPAERPHKPRMSLPGRPVLIMLTLMFAIAIAGALALAARRPGPEQPIPFSHRIHVSTKGLSCFFCHQSATRSSNAGMPSVQKCLLCHNVITTRWEPVARIRAYDRRGEGIPWVRVNRLPDFVQFSHQAHLARGFDCSVCHGNIKAMDRVWAVNDFKMGFCVDCHKANGATQDCFHCHY